jgi:hypothetical protein
MTRNTSDIKWKTQRSRVSNGKQMFLDGQVRSRASRRFRDLFNDIASEAEIISAPAKPSSPAAPH